MRLLLDLKSLTPDERRFAIGTIASFPPALPEYLEGKEMEEAAKAFTSTDEEDELEEVPAATKGPQLVQSGVELDTEGFPWDERIHSVNRTKTDAGVWRVKKGVKPEDVATVRGQVAQVAAIPAAPVTAIPAVPVAAIPTAPVEEKPVPVAEAQVAAPGITNDRTGFVKLAKFITDLKAANKITNDEVEANIMVETGGECSKLPEIAVKQQFIVAVYNACLATSNAK